MQGFRASNAKAISWTIRIGLLSFVLIGVFPPWTFRIGLSDIHVERSAGHHLILSPPAPDPNQRFSFRTSVHLDWPLLLLEWLILSGVIGGAFAWQFTRTGGSDGQTHTDERSDKQTHTRRTLVHAETVKKSLIRLLERLRELDSATSGLHVVLVVILSFLLLEIIVSFDSADWVAFVAASLCLLLSIAGFVWWIHRAASRARRADAVASSNEQKTSKLTDDEAERSSEKETRHPPTEAFPDKVPAKDIHSLPNLTPKHDERFSALLTGAVSGEVPVYFAAVPLAICVPFDPDYRPDLHPVGEQAISQMIEAGIRGQFQKLFVYQRGKWFVVSDDYITLFAALRGQPDYVPCWVLGKPDSGLVRDVQGPIASGDVPKLLGWAV